MGCMPSGSDPLGPPTPTSSGSLPPTRGSQGQSQRDQAGPGLGPPPQNLSLGLSPRAARRGMGCGVYLPLAASVSPSIKGVVIGPVLGQE